MLWDQDVTHLELGVPRPYHKIIIPLLTYRAIQMWTRRDRFEPCGLLGLWNHSACQGTTSPKALHMRSFESPNCWLFGKHLFGLEISRSSVNLPGPNPRLMECFINIRQQYFCYFTSNDQKCQWFPLSFLWIMEKLTASLGCSWGRYLLTILWKIFLLRNNTQTEMGPWH